MLAWRCHWYALLPSSTEWCTAGQLRCWTFYYTSSLFSTTVDIFCFSFLAHFGIKTTQGWNWLSIFSEVKVKSLSRVWLFVTPWTVVYQAPLSMGFSRQEYCSALPFPTPGHLPNPEIRPVSLASPALAGGFFTTSATCFTTFFSIRTPFSLKIFWIFLWC